MGTTIVYMNIQTVKFNDLSFIDVTNPGDLELKYLKNNFGFDSLHLDDYIHKNQIPKIEIFKNYSLLVFDFPYFAGSQLSNLPNQQHQDNDKSSFVKLFDSTKNAIPTVTFSHPERKKRILSSQIDLFIGKDYLVILHDGSLAPINDIFVHAQKTLRNRQELLSEGPIFLAYRIIDALVDSCFPVMNGLSSTIDRIDKELEVTQTSTTIEDISLTRRNIVVFQTMIKPVIPLFRQLEEGKYKELNGPMQPFWSNILDHLQKIWDRLEDSKELIEGISESNESILSYRSNEIVKFLTVITAVAFPFVIVNNLYSMNVVGLPFATYHGIVWILFGLIFVAGIDVLLYFKHRKWI